MKIKYIDNDNYWKDKYQKYRDRVYHTRNGKRKFSNEFADELKRSVQLINDTRNGNKMENSKSHDS